jgi:hypothetical protein|tara:strand:+ start:1112 stop:2755 length:1644 start_codon:yes stop_codon:yes gene_type:complete
MSMLPKIYRPICIVILAFMYHLPNAFCQNLVEEQVSYSIPKTIYFTEEKIWISAEVTQKGKPSSSQVLYAELLNRENESVHLAKILLEQGEALHFLEIPSNLPSDHYLLRIYTRISPLLNLENGMKQQLVTIFNPRIPPKVVANRSEQIVKKGHQKESYTLIQGQFNPKEIIDIPEELKGQKIQELKVSLVNPFLEEERQISSSQLYEGKAEGVLIPELFGHIVAAKVNPNEVDTSKVYFLSVHGIESALYSDRPDANGNLFFDIGGLKHWKFLIAQADQNGDLMNFELQSPAVKTRFKNGFTFPQLEISLADQELLQKLLLSSGVQTYFREKLNQEPVPVVTGFVADYSYNLDDYTRFESVETVIKEYVPSVAVRTRSGKKEFRSNNEFGNRFEGNPLMLVDGMPVFNSDQLAAFNPKSFEKLDVLARVFYLNEQNYEGVISFSSYKSDVGGFPLPTNAIYSPYQGIQIPVELESEFGQPQEIRNLQDLRSVLTWKSEARGRVDLSEVKIITSDLPGLYQMSIQYQSEDGSAQSWESYFEVKAAED